MNFDMHGFAAILAQRLPVRSDSPEGTEAAAAAIRRRGEAETLLLHQLGKRAERRAGIVFGEAFDLGQLLRSRDAQLARYVKQPA